MSTTTNKLNQTLSATNSTAEPIVLTSVKDDPKSGLDAYGQQLTAVSPVIANQGQSSVTLDQPNQTAYNLIAMRAKDLFPVANRMAVMPLDCSSQPSNKCTNSTAQYYDDLVINAAEAESMQQALKFYQSVSAFPGLEPGLSFIKLIGDCKKDSTNAESRINAFFQKTKSYSKCTLESFVAVQSYCFYYAFSWANFQDSFSYEVARVNSKADDSEGLLAAGSIVFTKKPSAPNPADVNDRNGGYEIAYHPAEGEAIPLALVDGILVSTENLTAPSVKLFFSYDLKRTFTGNEADNVVWPVLTGHIQQSQVIAVGIVKKSDSPAMIDINHVFGDWKRFYSPKTAKDWAKTIGLTAGVGLAIGVFALCTYFAVRREVKKIHDIAEKKNKEEKDKEEEKAQEDVQEFGKQSESTRGLLEFFGQLEEENPRTKEQLEREAAEREQLASSNKESVVKNSYKMAVDTQMKQVEFAREYGNPDALQDVEEGLLDLTDTLNKLEDASWEEFSKQTSGLKKTIATIDELLEKATEPMEEKLRELDQKAVNNGETPELMSTLENLRTQARGATENAGRFEEEITNELNLLEE